MFLSTQWDSAGWWHCCSLPSLLACLQRTGGFSFHSFCLNWFPTLQRERVHSSLPNFRLNPTFMPVKNKGISNCPRQPIPMTARAPCVGEIELETASTDEMTKCVPVPRSWLSLLTPFTCQAGDGTQVTPLYLHVFSLLSCGVLLPLLSVL